MSPIKSITYNISSHLIALNTAAYRVGRAVRCGAKLPDIVPQCPMSVPRCTTQQTGTTALLPTIDVHGAGHLAGHLGASTQ